MPKECDGTVTEVEPRRGQYPSWAYLGVLLLACLQFLQLRAGAVFFQDDLNFMVSLRDYGLLDFLKDATRVENPLCFPFIRFFIWLQDPFVVHLFILGVTLAGLVALVSVFDAAGVDWLVAVLVSAVCMSLAAGTEGVFFASAIQASIGWSFAMVSLALFVGAIRRRNRRKGFPLYALGVLTYWMGVLTGPYVAFVPLMAIPLVLSVRSLESAGDGARPKETSLLTMALLKLKHHRDSFGLAALFVLLTSGGFLAKKCLLGIHYHYYSLSGWINQTPSHMLAQGVVFLRNVAHSFGTWNARHLVAPPRQFLIPAIVTSIVLPLLIIQHFRGKTTVVPRCPQWSLAASLLVGAAMTLGPTTIIAFRVDRYDFAPAIFLVSGLLMVGYSGVIWVQARVGAMSSRLWILYSCGLAALLLFGGYNKYLHIQDRYVTWGNIWRSFARDVNRAVDVASLLPSSQLVILDHPAHRLTIGYDHWSSGLLALTLGRPDLRGIVARSTDPCALFSEQIWSVRGGVAFRRGTVGMRRDQPLAIYAYRDGSLVPVRFFAVKEEQEWRLYQSNLAGAPQLIMRTPKKEAITAYLGKLGVSQNEIWMSTPSPL